ncbi:hypothetical protein EU805_06480 [Salipiger sp. IMCC34102]|uniref:DUF7742 family protein n=1 Tax=Salipiger sp. IMCC34102 TaxID=2510647 RepID=UPI00101D6323|nr:hypothetical protein [Salipiger sp. IMCC34102]RYH03366.1 hypothetical protein EU805_06480 [Salipiger sp. IMCC34102]
MRPLGWLDLDAGVRCLLGRPQARQIGVADDLLRQADAADRYRKRMGYRHKVFGDGSLSAAAQGLGMVPVAARLDAEYLRALGVVLERIERRRMD